MATSERPRYETELRVEPDSDAGVPLEDAESYDLAVAHGDFTVLGGAERVAAELARTFDAPIYAAVVDQSVVPDDVEVVELFDGRIGRRAMQSHYLVQDLYQMFAWQHVEELYEYDTIVLNKNNPGWFVPRDEQTVVRYTHTTPRGHYDQFHRNPGGIHSVALKTAMRPLYRSTVDVTDGWICNSELVQRRIDGYWDIDQERVDVVHPPVDVESVEPAQSGDDYYVTVSRLEDHKRVDLLAKACAQSGKQLKIAGTGGEEEALREFAAGTPHVEVLGYVSESEKWELLRDAKALLFAAENEDFGIVPIEAFAAGTPVVGVADGMTQYQIVEGRNGVTFEPTVEDVAAAIETFEADGVDWDHRQLHAFAQQFGRESFREGVHVAVAEAREASRVERTFDTSDPLASARVPVTDGGVEDE